MKQFVSIITPTYNRLPLLKLVYTALQRQTEAIDEWVIADDGSTDGTKEWAKSIKDIPVKHLYLGESKEYKQGGARPRNEGARYADKQAIAYWFLDSDVLPYPDDLKLYKEAFNKNPKRVICGEYDWGKPMRITEYNVKNNWQSIIDETLPEIPNASPHGMLGRDIRAKEFAKASPDDLCWGLNCGLSTFAGNLLVPKDIFWEEWVNKKDPNDKTKGFDERLLLGEDGDFGLMTIEKGYPISLHKEIKGYHMYHPRNIAKILEMNKIYIPMIDKKHGMNVEQETKIIQRQNYDI